MVRLPSFVLPALHPFICFTFPFLNVNVVLCHLDSLSSYQLAVDSRLTRLLTSIFLSLCHRHSSCTAQWTSEETPEESSGQEHSCRPFSRLRTMNWLRCSLGSSKTSVPESYQVSLQWQSSIKRHTSPPLV
jgi:hypothetical protein